MRAKFMAYIDSTMEALASYLDDPDVEQYADGFLNNAVKTGFQQ